MDQQKLKLVITVMKTYLEILKLVQRDLEIKRKCLQLQIDQLNATLVAAKHIRDIEIALLNKQRTEPRKRRFKKKPTFENTGFWEVEVPKMTEDVFYENFRLDRATFKYIVDMVRPDLESDDWALNPVSTEKKVAIALTVLLSNAEYRVIGAMFGQGKTTVHNYFKAFINSAFRRLVPKHIRLPTHDQFRQHAAEFENRWGYAMAVGAVDGCHFKISVPEEHATDYYNYMDFHSVISIAVCDANYKVYYVKSGIPGRTNDAGGFRDTEFFKLAETGNLLPNDTTTIEGEEIPLHILGDSAFALKIWLMKPYPFNNSLERDKCCFNMHHSRARRVIENVFGRLKARWRRLLNHLPLKLEDVGKTIQVAFALNNICEERGVPFNQKWIDETRHVAIGLEQSSATTREYNERAKRMRDALKLHYFKRSEV